MLCISLMQKCQLENTFSYAYLTDRFSWKHLNFFIICVHIPETEGVCNLTPLPLVSYYLTYPNVSLELSKTFFLELIRLRSVSVLQIRKKH